MPCCKATIVKDQWSLHAYVWWRLGTRRRNLFGPLPTEASGELRFVTHICWVSSGARGAFSAAPNDCYDVAEWLIDNARMEYGYPLTFIGGESAGPKLAVLTVLHLLHSPTTRFSSFRFKGLVGHYGAYSLQWLASTRYFKKEPPLVLSPE
jgi:hypothetical protein